MLSPSSRSRVVDNDPVVIVAGVRTPFLKRATGFAKMRTVELAAAVVGELIARGGIDPELITGCVFGQAIPSLDYINLAREVVLRTELAGHRVVGHSVSQACLTSMQALTTAIHSIGAGEHDAMIVGGADNVDDVSIPANPKLIQTLRAVDKAPNAIEKARLLSSLSPKDLVPMTPGYTVEPTTGLSMGEHCERMAQDWGISRQEQDRLAHESHVKASRAWRGGFFDSQVMAVVPPDYSSAFVQDNMVRHDSNLADYEPLPPVFDTERGTITAGNASPLSAGAAALAVMRLSTAKAAGLTPLGKLRSWSYKAMAPDWHLLLAPAFAIPEALATAGLTLEDIDVVELHEAFAAQVACTLRALDSPSFCAERLGLGKPVGAIDPARVNINGGSLALGHPFAATAARLVLQALKQLHRTGGQFAVIGICAGGGQGVAAVVEGM